MATDLLTIPINLPYWPSKTEEQLSKFQVRTAYTVITGKRVAVYQNEIVQLAYSVGTMAIRSRRPLVLTDDRRNLFSNILY